MPAIKYTFFEINLEKKKEKKMKQRFYRFNYFNALFVYYVSNKRVYISEKLEFCFYYISFFLKTNIILKEKTLAQLDINFHGH